MKEISFTTEGKIKAIAELASYIDSLDGGKQYVITVEEKKKKRSLDANAYCWELLGKLASRLHESKTEIYRSYIREIGGNSETYQVKDEAVEMLREGWEHNGLGWVSDILASDRDGYTNVILYCGSSVYDTAQMSRLIDLIVQDCVMFGIQTKDPEELEKLVERWGGR